MNKLRFLGVTFTLACFYILLISHSNGMATGHNDDRTGAPNAGLCSNCHSGGSYGTPQVSIQVFTQNTTTPVTAYVAGTVYDMRVSVTPAQGSPGGYGFQMTALKTTGNTPLAGYSGLASNVKQKTITVGTYSGRTYVEHNNVSTSGIFNFKWTAPVQGTGSVRFYASGNAVNNTGGSSGDNPSNSNFLLPEAVPFSVSGVPTNITCAGGANGAINITATNGSSPYGYNWGNGITTEDRTGLTAGTYTVTVTDNASATASASFTLTQPAAISVTATTANVLCNGGNTGSINITATNGASPYSYNWGNNITSEDRTNLTAGTYTVTVSDNNSCTATSSSTITQPTLLNAANTAGTIACFGGTTSVTITASGGTTPYTGQLGSFTQAAGQQTYTVTDANGCSAGTIVSLSQPAQLSATATNDTIPCGGGSATITVSASGGTGPFTGTGNFNVSSAGNYNYTVTDANGCTANASSSVVAGSGLTSSFTKTDVSCNGVCNGVINVTATGGTLPYTYNWNNALSTANAANLCAGTYTQTVTDDAGCVLVNTYTINEPPLLTATVVSDTINCFGSMANINVNATGGTAPYSGIGTFAVTAGTYNYLVTDANGCTVNTATTITQPTALTITIAAITGSTGSDGIIDIDVQGAIPPYTIECLSNGQSFDTTGLAPGTYSVAITDANGCNDTLENVVVSSITGIGKNSEVIVSIYPNPAKETLHITNAAMAIYTVSIFSTDGKLLQSVTAEQANTTLNIAALQDALYIVEVKGTNTITKHKFYKSK